MTGLEMIWLLYWLRRAVGAFGGFVAFRRHNRQFWMGHSVCVSRRCRNRCCGVERVCFVRLGSFCWDIVW